MARFRLPRLPFWLPFGLSVGFLPGVLLPAGSGAAQETEGEVEGRLQVEGRSTLQGWSCEATRVLFRPGWGGEVFAHADPGEGSGAVLEGVERAAAEGEARGAPPPELLVSVPELDCGGGTINRHMREAMKAENHPWIRFTLQGVEGDEGPPPEGEAGPLRLQGTLEIQGRVRPLTVESRATWREGPRPGLHLEGSVDIDMTAWGVDPPTVLLGRIRVRDTIRIGWDLTLRP